MGLLLKLSSPLSITYPGGAREDIAVNNLKVVPEFSAFTTSSGKHSFPPLIRVQFSFS